MDILCTLGDSEFKPIARKRGTTTTMTFYLTMQKMMNRLLILSLMLMYRSKGIQVKIRHFCLFMFIFFEHF
jgi:hypothetical protein